jgi:hypothetical protein
MVAAANMVEVSALVGDTTRAAKLPASMSNEGEGYAMGRLQRVDQGQENGRFRRRAGR